MTKTVRFQPIGVIHTPFASQKGTPIQPTYAKDAVGEVILDPPFVPGLKDLDGFERIWLLYLLDRARAWRPLVVPYRDIEERGLFATRAPSRPCPIGLSVVEIVSVTGNTVSVRGVDMLDNTPLLDIKPYIPAIDAFPVSRAGWFDERVRDAKTADDRFDDNTPR
jgi:tRNA-Thr(GGU) m(6)t(6)A37 methyltransferase TsaA